MAYGASPYGSAPYGADADVGSGTAFTLVTGSLALTGNAIKSAAKQPLTLKTGALALTGNKVTVSGGTPIIVPGGFSPLGLGRWRI